MALSMTSPESPSSDYGSDFDTDGEETVQALLGSLEVNPIDSLALEPLVEDDNKSICIAHVPKSSQESGTTAYFSAPEEQVEGRASITVRVNNGTDTEAETGMRTKFMDLTATDELTAASCDAQGQWTNREGARGLCPP